MLSTRFEIGTLRTSICRFARRASSEIPSWKARVHVLLKRTDHLVETKIPLTGLCNPGTHNESYSLFNEWRHVLFKIPHEESTILSESANTIDKLLRAHLDKLSKTTRNGKHGFQPSPLLSDDLTTGIYAWGRTATQNKDSPMKAESIFEKFSEISDNGTPKYTPTSNMYSALVYCWSQASRNDRACEKCLDWFQTIGANKSMTVNSATWNALIRIHVRQRKFSKINKSLLQKYSSLNDGYTFASLVEGWLDSDLPDGHRNAYDELQRGIAFCLEERDRIPSLQQLLFLYLSKSIQQGRLFESERVMNQAIDIQQNHMELEILDKKHFVVVMKALASKGMTDNTNELFQKLKSLYGQGAQRFELNYQVLVILLSAIAKKRDQKSLEIGESLLSTIEEFLLDNESSESIITNHAYNVMLDFYVRSPHVNDKREKVEKLIMHMKWLSVEHNNPRLLPDKVSYTSLIKAMAQEDKHEDLFLEIDGILQKLECRNETSMQPDRRIYSIILETLFTSGDDAALRRAKDLVTRMKQQTKLQPDRIIYTILIKIHSLSNDVHGSDRQLHTMIRAYKSGRADCRPNEEAFVTAMSTWEQSGRKDSLDGALRIFNDMVGLYTSGNTDCRPSLKSFGKLMVILAKSDSESKMKRGRRLFSEMEKYRIIPDKSLFNWYIRVCATVNSKEPKDRRDSWTEALATFHTLRGNGMANSHTYNSIFYACDKLLRNDDDQCCIFREIFAKCQKDGQVNRRILTFLRRSLPSKFYSELTTLDPRDNSIQMTKIPESWKRNNKSRYVK